MKLRLALIVAILLTSAFCQAAGPARYDFTIYQGADFCTTLIWTDSTGSPIDLSGYKVRLYAKKNATDMTKVITWTSEGVSPNITLSTAVGYVQISATAAQTKALSFRTASYDIEMEDSLGVVTRLLYGTVSLSPGISH